MLTRIADPGLNGAKLTPRVLPAVFIKFSVWLGLSFAWPATIGGIALIGAVIFYVYRTTDDLLTCFYAGLCMAGNQVCSNCFSLLFEFKPFDGVALGLVGLTLAASCVSPIATGLLAFCSLWSDERSLISLMLIATVLFIVKPADASRSHRLLFSIGLALVGYIISRPMISWLAGWGSQDLSMLGTSVLSATLPFSGLVPWLSLEGAVILVIAVFRELSSRQEWYRSAVLAAALALAWASCLVVLDISRACCFLFVVIPLSIYLLSTFSVSRQELRRLTLYSAAISILAPNIYVIAGVVLNIIPSWAMLLLNT